MSLHHTCHELLVLLWYGSCRWAVMSVDSIFEMPARTRCKSSLVRTSVRRILKDCPFPSLWALTPADAQVSSH